MIDSQELRQEQLQRSEATPQPSGNLPSGTYSCRVESVEEIIGGRNDGDLKMTVRLEAGRILHQVLRPL